MALRPEELEFINRLDRMLSKNNRELSSSLNSILNDANITQMMSAVHNIRDAHTQVLYMELGGVVLLLTVMAFAYFVLSGRFVDYVYSRVREDLLRDTKALKASILQIGENLIDKVEIANNHLEKANGSFDEHSLLIKRYIKTLQDYEGEINWLAKSREETRQELFKTQNILQKKIQQLKKLKGGES